MEAVDDTARAHLRRLRSLDPPWTYSQSAQALGMSHPPARSSQLGVDRILPMRDEPPQGVRRTPGSTALRHWHLAWKAAATVAPEVDGKRQHVVQVQRAHGGGHPGARRGAGAHQVLKTLPLKGRTGHARRCEAFVQLMMDQARSERQLRTADARRGRLSGSDSPSRSEVRNQQGSQGCYPIHRA
jgi:hypothetical protein